MATKKKTTTKPKQPDRCAELEKWVKNYTEWYEKYASTVSTADSGGNPGGNPPPPPGTGNP